MSESGRLFARILHHLQEYKRWDNILFDYSLFLGKLTTDLGRLPILCQLINPAISQNLSSRFPRQYDFYKTLERLIDKNAKNPSAWREDCIQLPSKTNVGVRQPSLKSIPCKKKTSTMQ